MKNGLVVFRQTLYRSRWPPPATSAGPSSGLAGRSARPSARSAPARGGPGPLRCAHLVRRRHAGVQPGIEQVVALVGQKGVLPLFAKCRNCTYSHEVGWYIRSILRSRPDGRIQRHLVQVLYVPPGPGLPYWLAGTGRALRFRASSYLNPYGGIRLSLTTCCSARSGTFPGRAGGWAARCPRCRSPRRSRVVRERQLGIAQRRAAGSPTPASWRSGPRRPSCSPD